MNSIKSLAFAGLSLAMSASLVNSEIIHTGTVSMIRAHGANSEPGIERSWTTLQLSGLESSDVCPGQDEGLGDLAYLSLLDSEEFTLTLLLSAYLGGYQVTANIDDSDRFAGYCHLRQLSITPSKPVDQGPDEEILKFDHEDLIVAYTMDKIEGGALIDEGPYNINGAIKGAKKNVDGVVGSALSFDDRAEKVNLGENLTPILSANDAKFTISVWVKMDTNAGFVRIFTKSTETSNGTNRQQMVLQTDSRQNLLFGWYGDDTGQVRRIIQGPKLNSNEWQHIALSYDGTLATNNGLDRAKMYINGAAVSTSFYSNTGLLSAIHNGGGSLTIGGEVGAVKTGSVGFSGLIDQVRIFKRPITPAEALHLYSEGG